VTFRSLCLQSDLYTFLGDDGKAVKLNPLQVFNFLPALEALPLDQQTLLAKKLAFQATKTA